MPGQLIHFDRHDARAWSRRARAAGIDDAHQADVSRRIRLLQARASGNLVEPVRDKPLIQLDGKFRNRDMSFRDLVVIVCTIFALAWWGIFGL